RDFKAVQRTFRDVEAAVAERDMVDKLPDPAEVAQKREALRAARAELEQKKAELKPVERELLARREVTDESYRSVKADYDAYASSRNIASAEVGQSPADSSEGKARLAAAERWDNKVSDTEAKLQKAKAEFDAADLAYRTKVRDHLEPLEKKVTDGEDDLKKLTGTSDRYAKLATQKAWGSGDTFRALPILDGFASPTKINQLWLPDLTIDYGGFKDVPRYDRCTTCHLGIDRANYDKSTLTKLGDVEESDRLNCH